MRRVGCGLASRVVGRSVGRQLIWRLIDELIRFIGGASRTAAEAERGRSLGPVGGTAANLAREYDGMAEIRCRIIYHGEFEERWNMEDKRCESRKRTSNSVCAGATPTA